MRDGVTRDGEGLVPRPAWLVILIAPLLLIAAGLYYGLLQNIWIDETTQLSGMRLPMGRLLAWLAGAPEPFGVPPDRMPPVSYLIDGLCWRTLCSDAFDFRLLHLIIMAAGVAILLWLVARRYGTVATLVAGAMLVLSPAAVETAVEIRAYPIFFAITAVQLVLFFRLAAAPRPAAWPLIGFAIAGILAVYVHFYGLVSTSALFVGLIVARARDWRTLAVLAGALAAVLAASAGILPFVGGASAISHGEPAPGTGPSEMLLYLLRLVVSSAMMLAPVVTALYLAALGVLLLLAVSGAVTRPLFRPMGDTAALAIAIAAGVAATLLASLVIHNFYALKPSYSVWLRPALAVLAGAACDPRAAGVWRRRLARGAALAMVAALIPLQMLFLRHADWFVHGPSRALEAEIGAAPGETAIVYVDPNWGTAYFPLVYRYHGALAQFIAGADGGLRRIGPGGDPNTPLVPASALDRFRHLLVVSVRFGSYRDLNALRAGSAPPALMAPPGADGIDLTPGRWRAAGGVVRPGNYWLRLTRLEREDQR